MKTKLCLKNKIISIMQLKELKEYFDIIYDYNENNTSLIGIDVEKNILTINEIGVDIDYSSWLMTQKPLHEIIQNVLVGMEDFNNII